VFAEQIGIAIGGHLLRRYGPRPVAVMLLSPANPEGAPMDVFDGIRAGVAPMGALKVHPGAPHGLAETEAEKFNHVVLAFIESRGRRPATRTGAVRMRRNDASGLSTANQPAAAFERHAPFGGRKGSGYGPREQRR
jgi:hypothetical protein